VCRLPGTEGEDIVITLATDDNMGLTPDQVEVVEVLSRLGDVNETAKEVGVSRSAVSQCLTRACRRVHVPNRMLLVLAWERWKAGKVAAG
jgi:DNA-binding NarL/FixJ family response regulator